MADGEDVGLSEGFFFFLRLLVHMCMLMKMTQMNKKTDGVKKRDDD